MKIEDLGNKDIRRLINSALDDDQFQEMCQDDFSQVFERFTSGQSKAQRIRLLVEFVVKQREIPKLLAAIEALNSKAHADFIGKFEEPLVQDEVSPVDITCDILVLAANPLGTDPLKLQQEVELIQSRLDESSGGKKLIVRVEPAARAEDLSRYLLESKPRIVHFAGHGNSSGDIIFENEQNKAVPVSASALAELFASVQGQIDCVVLNACFSFEKANGLKEHVGSVIGMSQGIENQSALRFAAGFYRGLGFGCSYELAFRLGRNELDLLNLPDTDVPQLVSLDKTSQSFHLTEENISREFPNVLLEEAEPSFNSSFTKGLVSDVPEEEIPSWVEILREENLEEIGHGYFALEDQLDKALVYPLWYGTNRKPKDSTDISKGFSGDRDQHIHYGTCEVTVPKSHKIGSTGSSWWQRLLTRRDDRLKLDSLSLRMLNGNDYWADMRRALLENHAEKRMGLVFIHGFNVSFEAAALRAAQIGVDLQVPGITAFYSWPSKGNILGYPADEASIQASEGFMAQFLIDFVRESGAQQVHLIAHSMGNRGLLRSLQRIMQQTQGQSDIRFGQIFLAAPDEDPDVFRELAVAYQAVADRTTLYVSSKDKALASSGLIHDEPRAGFSPPITLVPGVDTVEVSNIDLTVLGHGYYGDARPVLQDMHDLLWENTPPDRRFGLSRIEVEQQKYYWQISG